MIRDAFHRFGTLRRIRWTFVPGPATAAPPHRPTRNARWMALSRHPGSSPVHCRFTSAESDSRRVFAWDARRRFTADDGPALGPRSLVPPPFLGRCARAYLGPNDVAQRLLQLLRRAGTSTRAPESSKGRRPRPPSFSHAPCSSSCEDDGTRRAALRPFSTAPVPVRPGCPGLPDRDARESA